MTLGDRDNMDGVIAAAEPRSGSFGDSRVNGCGCFPHPRANDSYFMVKEESFAFVLTKSTRTE